MEAAGVGMWEVRAAAATTLQGVSARTRGRHRRDGLEYVPPSFGRKFREEALPSIIPRNTKTRKRSVGRAAQLSSGTGSPRAWAVMASVR
jgi:hypothetical protein